MELQQLYTGCLAQGAYYIENKGEAAVIDPLRETDGYIQLASSRQARIKYIFETHFHADFVSGHVDLARKTGAKIIYGPTEMVTGFDATIATDGQEFVLGDVRIRVIHTPGHTLESSCYLLIDEAGKEKALFTGDTLFIGDVGRPDLAQHVIASLTEEKLASMLYDSLRDKIMPLSDNIIVYPGHGAGSACGKNIGKEASDTLGHQKKTNYALKPSLSKAEFIKTVLSGLTQPPGYFPENVLMNIRGYENFDQVIARGTTPLSVEAFEDLLYEEDALVVDTRNAAEFKRGFIPGSWNIGLNGSFAVWAGTLIKDIRRKIILVTDPGKETEAVTRLARVGYDNCVGYLKGGFDAWRKTGREVDTISSISVDELGALMESQQINLIDVRKKSEFESEHVVGAINAPLDYIDETEKLLNRHHTYYVHCAAGYRSAIFLSILKSHGFEHIVDVEGGFAALKESGKFPVTEYVCPTTAL